MYRKFWVRKIELIDRMLTILKTEKIDYTSEVYVCVSHFISYVTNYIFSL